MSIKTVRVPEHLRRIPVKFVRSLPPYNEGDVAGFFAAKVAQLVKDQYAVFLDKEGEAAAHKAQAELEAKEAAAKAVLSAEPPQGPPGVEEEVASEEPSREGKGKGTSTKRSGKVL